VSVKRYVKKPVVVSAVQFDGTNINEILDWVAADGVCQPYIRSGGIFIPTLEGDMRADLGDFIIKGVRGEFYPCKPGIFEQTYELVS
jgi:hypothetical protein